MIKKILGIAIIVVLIFAFGIVLENKIRKDFANLDLNKVEVIKNKPPTPPVGEYGEAKKTVTVKRVIDGDTIELSDGRKVRYIGINAPEMTDKRAEVPCFAKMAKAENQKLVENKVVEMEKDVSDKDKYNRLLRYVWINGKMINFALVEGGYAKTATYPPDVKYKDLFLAAEKSANKLICKGF